MSLLTVARYVTITGDDTTDPGTASARIEDAEAELEEVLDRPLAEAERTEAMRPDRGGMLWPKATPIDEATGYIVDGVGLRADNAGIVPSFVSGSTTVSVTYTGGWTAATVPRSIERDLAWATYALLNPDTLRERAAMPSNATSVRLGDVGITFGAGGANALGDIAIQWSQRTLSYRYSPPRGPR